MSAADIGAALLIMQSEAIVFQVKASGKERRGVKPTFANGDFNYILERTELKKYQVGIENKIFILDGLDEVSLKIKNLEEYV